MRRSIGCFLVALLAFSVAAWAEAPNYTYVEAGYLDVDIDDLDDTGDGIFYGASWGLKAWHILGEYSDLDTDSNIEQTAWRAGVGWHGLLGERADFVAEASYIDIDIEAPGIDTGDDGFGLRGGLRIVPIKLLEVGGYFDYVDLSDAGSDEAWELEAIWNLGRLGIGATWEIADDVETITGFLRLNMGRN